MSNSQDTKRPDRQNDKPKPSPQPTEPGSNPESRRGQGGRPAEGQEYPKSGEQKKKISTDEDEDSDEQGNQ